MEIKPIKLVQRIRSAELPDTKISPDQPRGRPQFNPPAGKWLFRSGQIILNGQDVATYLAQAQNEPPANLTKLAHDLAAYYQYMLHRHGRRRKKKLGDQIIVELVPDEELLHLAALVEAYIGKIMRLLKKRYDETADGYSLLLDEAGQLILNGMNVTAFILMSREHPTPKAKMFLRGLKNRLTNILKDKQNAHNYERLLEAIHELFDQIDAEILRLT